MGRREIHLLEANQPRSNEFRKLSWHFSFGFTRDLTNMISVLSGNQFLSGFFAAIYPNIRELNLLDPVAIVRSNAEF
jgi:hypothetical protein